MLWGAPESGDFVSAQHRHKVSRRQLEHNRDAQVRREGGLDQRRDDAGGIFAVSADCTVREVGAGESVGIGQKTQRTNAVNEPFVDRVAVAQVGRPGHIVVVVQAQHDVRLNRQTHVEGRRHAGRPSGPSIAQALLDGCRVRDRARVRRAFGCREEQGRGEARRALIRRIYDLAGADPELCRTGHRREWRALRNRGGSAPQNQAKVNAAVR
jgi:hypothetical protein